MHDVNRAAGGNPNHRPGEWLRNKQTQELVAELGGAEIPAGPARGVSANSQTPVATLNDGRNNGAYVTNELDYGAPKFSGTVKR